MLHKIAWTYGLAIALSISVFPRVNPSQSAPQQGMKKSASKEARWEGIVIRHDANGQTFTVRKRGTEDDKVIHYDSSTEFVSQAHGSKKANPIDAGDIKDNDRVICLGHFDDKGKFEARVISKRLVP
ncbi:MAG TPA: hypothetical protein VL155_19920 [Terriglobales bacterium]|jgi:hypothetical protein|nr:hypothetical protein [Terriglobales bacterium]